MTEDNVQKLENPADDQKRKLGVGDSERFLIFDVGETLYGTPLLSVREVIEAQQIKPVPYAPPYFLGIMNLRGRVVSIIDLRKKFRVSKERESEKAYIMILDLEDTSIGVQIDKVISVQSLSVDDVSYLPTVDANIDSEYLIGAARLTDQLITLVELAKLIDKQEVEKFRRSVAAE
jgi:purine-binding chemotaxis protein CheW